MKITLVTVMVMLAMQSFGRKLVLTAEKGSDGKTHWMPEKIEVTQGEAVTIVAKYDVKGAYDFHGLSIPVLKIQKEVYLGKPVEVSTVVPKDLKEGEYKVACHVHDTHVPATLVVKAKTAVH